MKLVNGFIISSSVLFLACGGGDGGNDLVDASPNNADAPVGGGPCMIADALGTIEPAQQPAAFSMGGTPENPDGIEVRGPFNQAGFETDWFAIRLYKGTQTFPNSITPGTYDLAGPELDYNTCGVCVMLVGDHSGERAEEATNTYMATGGSITISSAAPTFSATLTNATFRHIAFDGAGAQVLNASGCTASVDSLTLNANLIQLLWGESRAMPSTGWPGAARVESYLAHE